MIDSHSHELDGLVIASGFPKKKLLEAFSRYLKEYLEEAYSLNPSIRYSAKRSLKHKLSKFKKLNPSFGRRILVRNPNNLFNIVRNRPTPFIFGSEESPATAASTERRYMYVDTYTLESPRITPRQLNNRSRRFSRGNANNVATNHVITHTTSVLEQIPRPPPVLIENQMESTQLVNSSADEMVSVDDATEVDTVSSTSPLTTRDIRREIVELRDNLATSIIQSGSTSRFTNQIIEEANEVIRQFNELHIESDIDDNDNQDEDDIAEPMELEETPLNSTSDEDDESKTEDEVED